MLNIITNGYVLPFITKPKLVPLIHSGYRAHQKDLAQASCIQSLLSKNVIERVENIKSLGLYSRLFLVPKPHQRWRPVIDLSRLNTFLLGRKVQNGNTRVHQGLSDSRGMGVINRAVRQLFSHPHPPKLKVVPKVLPQFSGVPIHLSSFRPSHGPTGLYNDCKRSEADGPHKGSQASPIPGQLAYQSSVSEGSTSKHSDRGRPDTVTGEVQTQTYSCVLVRGLRILPRFSPCKPTQERWLNLQDLIQVPMLFDCKMFDVACCGLLTSKGKMVPEGCLHMRPFQFHLKEHWRYLQSLDTLLSWSETISAHLEWGKTPQT